MTLTMPASKLQSRLGTYVARSGAGETVRAFIPPPLLPVPKLELDRLYQQLEGANQCFGRLNSMTKKLPKRAIPPLSIRPQRGSALFANRRYAILIYGPVI